MKKLWIAIRNALIINSFYDDAVYLRSKTMGYILRNTNNGFILKNPILLIAAPSKITEVVIYDGEVCYNTVDRSGYSHLYFSLGLLNLEDLVHIAEALRTGEVSFHP